MDCICCFFRTHLRFYLLLCVLSVAPFSHAATRIQFSGPSSQSVSTNVESVTRAGSDISVTSKPLEGEYIQSSGPGKGVRLPIKKRVDYSIGRIIKHAKGMRAGGVLGVAASIGLGIMFDGIDALMDQNGQPTVKKKVGLPLSGVYFCFQSVVTNCSDTSLASNVAKYSKPSLFFDRIKIERTNSRNTYFYVGATAITASIYRVSWNRHHDGVGTYNGLPVDYPEYLDLNRFGACPDGALYETSSFSCYKMEFQPIDDADIDAMFAKVDGQPSHFHHELMKDLCAASLNPSGCFSDMTTRTQLAGPATVTGPSTTTTSTYTKTDGTTGAGSTTTNTRYNITYGPSYYDYSKTTTIVESKDGQVTGTDETTESPEVTEEEKPEEEKEEPSPCTANCSGPEYVDAYKPTTKTKNNELDSYKSRVGSIPIISAVTGFFSVSVSASCPVWKYNGNLGLFSVSMPIDLIFDFHCQPWFIALGPWVSAIMLLGCTFIAFRVAVL